MNRARFRSLLVFVVVFALVNVAILATGSSYLYAVVQHRWAGIDDYRFFANREVRAGTPQPWPLDAAYGKPALTPAQERFIRDEMKSVAFVVLRDGKLLFEKYWEGRDASSRSGSFSMAKSMVSMLIGVALDEGKLKSVDQTLGELVPHHRGTDKAKLRIVDLLTMSAGLDYTESYNSPFAGSARSYYTDDLAAQADALHVVSTPGRVFQYQSANQLYLAQILSSVTHTSLSEYFSEKLWQPLGATQPALWSTDRPGGLEKAYCCVTATARDFARLGQLYLDKGVWHGRRLVSEDYVTRSLTPAKLVDASGKPNTDYGYSWWLSHEAGHDTFSMRGILGQFVLVVPDARVVIVRLGHETFMPDSPDYRRDTTAYIEAGLSLSR